jgi:glycosyltransferase involved in cell wall biosynthesis
MREQIATGERTLQGPNADPYPKATPKTAQSITTRLPDHKAAFVEAFVDEPNRGDFAVVAVIPAYNEDRFVGSVVLKAGMFVERVIVVDDGSTDHTAVVASQAGADVIVHPTNLGKASALATAFDRACQEEADIIVMLDGDGQHNPQEIPDVIRPILRGQADMVIGSRFHGQQNHIPAWRRLGQHTLTLLTNATSGTRCSDSQSGFRAFTRHALMNLGLQCRGFAVESELQFWAREQNLRVVETSISCVYVEKSKRNPWRHGLQVLNSIIYLISQWRPLLLFGLTGLLLTFAGLAWWGWIVEKHSRSGELALGYAMLATLFIILGVLSAFQGMTLHVMRQMMLKLPNGATRSTARQHARSPADDREEHG